MPELPEVQALADFVTEHAAGLALDRVDIATINALKTFDPPPSALYGALVGGARRYGKFLAIDLSGHYLVIHLARAGWLRWRDELPSAPLRPGKTPLAVRVHLRRADDGSPAGGFDLTEAGTRKGLACYLVGDPREVPGIARLGPDPLAPEFTVDALGALLAGQRTQLKGLLRDQSVIAGIGNAYSDEVLHVARMSPFRIAATLTAEEVATLHAAIVDTLRGATERARGLAAGELKAEKKLNLRVHGRTGQPCPVCGDTIREVSYRDSSLQYCPTCQTGGKPLADRRMSRLLK
jgi:DNA-formamidopyrimidine glycosylase